MVATRFAFQLGIENDDYWRQHEETYSRINPLFVPMLMQRVGAVATRSMVISDEELFETRFYKEWAKPQGLNDVVGVKVLQTDQRQGFFTADRFVSQPRYGERELRLLTLLSPHICRAVAISDVLNLKTIRSEALEATLNALSCGCLFDGPTLPSRLHEPHGGAPNKDEQCAAHREQSP